MLSLPNFTFRSVPCSHGFCPCSSVNFANVSPLSRCQSIPVHSTIFLAFSTSHISFDCSTSPISFRFHFTIVLLSSASPFPLCYQLHHVYSVLHRTMFLLFSALPFSFCSPLHQFPSIVLVHMLSHYTQQTHYGLRPHNCNRWFRVRCPAC